MKDYLAAILGATAILYLAVYNEEQRKIRHQIAELEGPAAVAQLNAWEAEEARNMDPPDNGWDLR